LCKKNQNTPIYNKCLIIDLNLRNSQRCCLFYFWAWNFLYIFQQNCTYETMDVDSNSTLSTMTSSSAETLSTITSSTYKNGGQLEERLSTGEMIQLSRIPGQASVRSSRPRVAPTLMEGWLLHFTDQNATRRYLLSPFLKNQHIFINFCSLMYIQNRTDNLGERTDRNHIN